MTIGLCLAALCFILLPSVSRSAPARMAADPADHLIRANRDGLAIDPFTEKPYVRPEQFAKHINKVLDQAEEWGRKRSSGSGRATVRLLVHVHGGLNSFGDTRQRMELVPVIMNERADWYYPVFIVWPSGFFETYGEHLLWIRQGQRVNVIKGGITLPIVLSMDVLTALVSTPRHWLYQLENIKDRAVKPMA